MPPVTKPAGTFPEADERHLRPALTRNGRPHRQPKKPVSLKRPPHGFHRQDRTRQHKQRAVNPRVSHAYHAARSSRYFVSSRSARFDASPDSSHSRSRSSISRSYSDRGSRPPRRGSSRSPSINLRNSSPSGSANRAVFILMASGDRVFSHKYPVRSGRCATPSSESDRSSSEE